MKKLTLFGRVTLLLFVLAGCKKTIPTTAVKHQVQIM
jgi:uncharacterized protein YcfL